MKVFVTGATGFIGSYLVSRMRQAGHQIVATGQANSFAEQQRESQLDALGVPVMPIAVTDKPGLAKAASGCTVLYHLAAAQHEANVPDQHFWDVNVEGTRNVLDACISAGVTRVVHGSTIGVYGEATDGEIDEETPARPDNIYGVTKLAGEKVALSFGDRAHVTSIRISETYGPGDWRLLKLFKAIRKGRFFVIGNGLNIHQLIHVDDLVNCLVAASTNDEADGEILVVAGSERLTTIAMCEAIAKSVARALPRWHAPMWPFYCLAVLMEKTLGSVGIQPPLHRRRLDFFRKSFLFSQSKSMRVLKSPPKITFADGAIETAVWYRDQALL